MSRYLILVAMVAASMIACGSGGDTTSGSDTFVSEDNSTPGDNSVPDNSADGATPDVVLPDLLPPDNPSIDSVDTTDEASEEAEIGECKLPEPYGEGAWCPTYECTLFMVDPIECTWGCGSGPDGKSPPLAFKGAHTQAFPGVCEY